MSRQRSVGSRPLLEALEGRLALSAEVNANGVLVIIGSPEADTIVIEPGGETGTAILTGVPGVPDGTVFSGFENVSVDLKSGNDTFTSEGTLTNAAGFGCELRVLGGNGNDLITIGQDNSFVTINGRNAHDTINGGPSNETLRGGRGRDTIFGNDGFDILHGGLGKDLLIGGTGMDTLNGGNQADELWGGIGIDILNGGLHRDSLFGGGGPDELTGGPAQDTFHGAPGEALDFNAEDANFNALFDPGRNIVLLGPTFWNLLATGENAGTQRNTELQLAAVNPFELAFPGIAEVALNLRETFAGLSPSETAAARDPLFAVTQAFSQDVLADPAGLTEQRMNQLRDELFAAAGEAIQPQFGSFISAFIEDLLDRRLVERVNALQANSASTQAFLNAVDSLFGLADLPP